MSHNPPSIDLDELPETEGPLDRAFRLLAEVRELIDAELADEETPSGQPGFDATGHYS